MAAAPQSILVTALQKGHSPDQVAATLQAQGHDEVSTALLLREYKKLRNAKRQFTGFVLMAIGAFVGFLSCMLTILHILPLGLSLYGLTSLAIIIVFAGMYYVFE
ncbi:MAG: hypothetical protein IT256_04025 [Chitinophagaceae bacterium]|nr:hypothetical protein [Chitinophagaceae bacterium]